MINQHPSVRVNAAPASREPAWNVEGFLEIQSIVGRDRAETLLRSYVLHLELASALIRDSGFDTAHLREVAHNLKSMSGQLGFEALHDFCDGVLMRPQSAPFGDAIEPLLALIDDSREAARSHGRRPAVVAAGRVA